MSTPPVNFIGTANEAERLANDSLKYRALAKAISRRMRVAMPGVIASFDSVAQTVSVDIAVFDKIKPGLPQHLANYNPTTGDIKIPTLIDVPIVLPRAGGFALTMPIQAGDECLVICADYCINEWFDAGGTQNVQQRQRRHNLSDAFAVLGPWSTPNRLTGYSSSGAQLRSDDGLTSITIENGDITIEAETVELAAVNLALTGTVTPSVGNPTFSLPVSIDGVSYKLMLQLA